MFCIFVESHNLKNMKAKLILIVSLLILVLLSTKGFAQYTKLWDFNGGTIDGMNPQGSLTYDGLFLYGTTYQGGNSNYGIIFKIKPDGTGYTNLFSFAGGSSGISPNYETLLLEGNFLYGMTHAGGSNNKGIIYKIQTDGTGFVKLLDFSGTSNGAYPYGSLISDGTYLYGTTEQGGTNNLGVIFRIMLDGSGFSKLFNFTNSSGSYPSCKLSHDGTYLYGTTSSGGTGGVGTIYKILTDGTGFTKLYDCSPTVGICYSPIGGVIKDGSYLYGSSYASSGAGCGKIFRINTDGTGDTTLLEFVGVPDGCSPYCRLITDGTYLFGTTNVGGALDKGTVFKVKLDGTDYSKLLDFQGVSNGANIRGSLLSDGNAIYGMTNMGGSNNFGTIFKIENVITTVGVNEINSNNFIEIFPNPSYDILTIKSSDEGSFQLINAMGQTLKRFDLIPNGSFTFSTENLKQGIYYIIGESKGQIFNKTVVIAK